MEVVIVALIVSVLAPAITGFVRSKTARAEKREDWARQDQVAAKAEVAYKAIVDANFTVAETVATNSLGLNTKLDVIHTLVNSQLTKAMESERAAIERELAMMEEVVALKKSVGAEPSKGALAAIDLTKAMLRDLTVQLEERAKQQEIVDMQLHQEKSVAGHLKSTLDAAGVEFHEGN